MQIAVTINQRAEADRFIADLRHAARRAQRTGGLYTVYLRDAATGAAVAVSLQWPPYATENPRTQERARQKPERTPRK